MTTNKEQSHHTNTGRSLAKFLIGLLAIAIGGRLLYQFFAPEEAVAPTEEVTAQNSAASQGVANTNLSNQVESDDDTSTEGDEDPTAGGVGGPDELSLEENDGSGAVFNAASITNEDYTTSETSDTTIYLYTDENAISVMPRSSEDIVRNSLSVDEELPFSVNGVDGSEITGSSLKDGATITYLLLYNDDTLFFVRGSSTFLESVKTNFRLQ